MAPVLSIMIKLKASGSFTGKPYPPVKVTVPSLQACVWLMLKNGSEGQPTSQL